MNCKKIKELLLTDYADNCIAETDLLELNAHLLVCNNCSTYKEKLFLNVINPLRGQAHVQLPSNLQAKVRSALYIENSKKHSAFSFFSFLHGWRAVASMCGLFMLALVLMHTPSVKEKNADLNISYISETVYGESSEVNSSNALNFGTAVETYLL